MVNAHMLRNVCRYIRTLHRELRPANENCFSKQYTPNYRLFLVIEHAIIIVCIFDLYQLPELIAQQIGSHRDHHQTLMIGK